MGRLYIYRSMNGWFLWDQLVGKYTNRPHGSYGYCNWLFYCPMATNTQWLFLVPLKGGSKWVYTANWEIICYLPPFRGTRNNHWNTIIQHFCCTFGEVICLGFLSRLSLPSKKKTRYFSIALRIPWGPSNGRGPERTCIFRRGGVFGSSKWRRGPLRVLRDP